MDFREFTNKVAKREGPKKAKISNSWGIYDTYKAIRKNKWFNIGRPLTEHEYYSIVRNVNKLLANEIANGREVTFPNNMGILELRKLRRGVSIVNGKLRITYPINWEETLRLWFEDEEARKNKTLLRDESEFLYHVKYNKRKATYTNQYFYEFAVNRFIKIALRENVKQGKIDSLW